ncbi:hypothetical protein ACNKHO_20205 [Shigella flexneri]
MWEVELTPFSDTDRASPPPLWMPLTPPAIFSVTLDEYWKAWR